MIGAIRGMAVYEAGLKIESGGWVLLREMPDDVSEQCEDREQKKRGRFSRNKTVKTEGHQHRRKLCGTR